MTGAPELIRVVERRVRDYLEARLRWEVEAQQLSKRGEREGTLGTQINVIKAGYKSLLSEFFASEVVDREPRYAFGDPPSVDPARTKVLDVHVTGGRASVTTKEPGHPLLDDPTFEYQLRLVEGTWRILDRIETVGGRQIKRVF